MEPGELELRKAFEEVTTKNVQTNIDYSKDTREIVRELEKRVENLDALIRSQNTIINNLNIRLATIQNKLISGGT
jgi:uncharacterized coiled-coil protein SlyX